ncbi:MAG: hypothetical protein LBJ04_12945 [Sphingobacterium sp.]|uniref:hypothetical protein n=1 Tax=Sphingobacterium sp. TaxID=341027 RepID=UPI002836256B|nr:hypothetical protein [Sphingobacterium sp.]MDR0264119.1 hypothetical protein [Sphingobacterium sp.]
MTVILSQQDDGVFVGTTDEKVIGWIQLHKVISLDLVPIWKSWAWFSTINTGVRG